MEPAVAEEAASPGRIGNMDWCCCMGCGPMPSSRESLCCQDQEMAVLSDKGLKQVTA